MTDDRPLRALVCDQTRAHFECIDQVLATPAVADHLADRARVDRARADAVQDVLAMIDRVLPTYAEPQQVGIRSVRVLVEVLAPRPLGDTPPTEPRCACPFYAGLHQWDCPPEARAERATRTTPAPTTGDQQVSGWRAHATQYAEERDAAVSTLSALLTDLRALARRYEPGSLPSDALRGLIARHTHPAPTTGDQR